MRVLGAVVGLVVILSPASISSGQQTNRSLLKATFSKLPIYFIENKGLYPREVAYYVQGADKTLFFTKDGITFRLKGKDGGWVLKLEFVGASPDVRPRGEDRQQAVFSYFKGPEKEWKTGLRTYANVVYEDLWPGIDLIYHGTVNKLKYEFLVSPGADSAKIRLRYRGVTSLSTTDAGALRVETPEGSFEDTPPVAWQEIDGKRVPVEVSFRLAPETEGEGTAFAFRVGDYDHTLPLVLDPAVLVYCGYIGGNASGGEIGNGIAVDGAGCAYVTGSTDSSEQTFPVSIGPDLVHNGRTDAFVAKVNASGTALVYCGFIGGTSQDFAAGIAVDAAGAAYVTGQTQSDQQTFPVTVGPDLTFNGGNFPWPVDAFVAKVNPRGSALVYCGYIGGNGTDSGNGIAVDTAGNAYVTGSTGSTEQTFPVSVGPDLTHNGGLSDAFVAKVKAAGTGLAYCGYVGGNAEDSGSDIAVDAAGSAYVTGATESREQTFPVAVGPDLTHDGGYDAFVAKVNVQGTGLVYCGYIGGAAHDWGYGIAVDLTGNAYVTGSAGSSESSFPVTVGPDLTYNGRFEDAFVAKVGVSGVGLVYCGYVGGGQNDRGNSIAVDGGGNAYVTGMTDSTEQTFPVAVGPALTPGGGGGMDAFVAKVSVSGVGLVYCGYIGGAHNDFGFRIAVDRAGNAFVTGCAVSDEKTFPVNVGPDVTFNGAVDAFVAKVALTLLQVSGTPRPAGTIIFDLTASADVGLPYQLGTSLGTGPIPIDTRKLNVSLDDLLLVTVNNHWPSIFSGYRGVIDSKGQAQATIHIPNAPVLIGTRLHSAFVTLDPKAVSGVRSISNTDSFTIAR